MMKLETVNFNNSFSLLVEERDAKLFNEQLENVRTLAALFGYEVRFTETKFRHIYMYINKSEDFYVDISIKIHFFHDNRLNKIDLITDPSKKISKRFTFNKDYKEFFKEIIKRIE